MLCVLVFVGFGHTFISGAGNVLYKNCYYDCGGKKNGSFYDRAYTVSPSYSCPNKFAKT